MTDINELEALARKATPGPWQAFTTGVRGGDHWYVTADGEAIAYATKNDGDPGDKCQENAEYIAAADPPTVLALIADLRRAQECIDATKNMLGDEKRNPAMRLLGIAQAVITYDEGKTQAQAEPEWEYECKLDDSGWTPIDDVTHFQRCRGEGRRRRKAGPWEPVEATDD